MTLAERDSLLPLSMVNLKNRLAILDWGIKEGIKEQIATCNLNELIRQRTVVRGAIKDKLVIERRKKKSGIIIALNPININVFGRGIVGGS